MANFFSDNKDLQFHLQHPLMRKIVELKERGFAEKDLYDYAPQDFDDAMDNYRRVLEIAGEVCGEVIAPNAEGVDHEGPRVVDDHVEYASGTVENMKAVVDAGLSGMTLPRKYDGLNFPLICFVMANEMVARADASFENIWGLQDCAETLNEFASEEIKQKYLPWVSAGATWRTSTTCGPNSWPPCPGWARSRPTTSSARWNARRRFPSSACCSGWESASWARPRPNTSPSISARWTP